MDARNFTVSDLRKEATKQKIKGRSKMNREQLCIALGYGDCGKRALVKKRRPKKEGVEGKKEGGEGKKEGVKGFDVDAYIKILPFLNQITHLDLSKQGIEELRPETFKLLKKLQSLNLSGNCLTSLPPNIFKHNTELQSLNLSGNRLTSLPPNLLEYNSKLYQLDLSENRLTSLPPNFVKNKPELELDFKQLETLIDKEKNGVMENRVKNKE